VNYLCPAIVYNQLFFDAPDEAHNAVFPVQICSSDSLRQADIAAE